MDVLGPAAKKRLFGGYTVSPLSVVFASVIVFQKGALLAYARANQYERLCTLISEPGGEASVAETTRNVARKNWNTYGGNSKSLSDYILRSEFPTFNVGDMAMLRWMSKQKMRLGETFNGVQISTANGMGFGATFPDVFRTMWEDSYEDPDPAKLARAVEAGVDIPAMLGQIAPSRCRKICPARNCQLRTRGSRKSDCPVETRRDRMIRQSLQLIDVFEVRPRNGSSWF